MKAERLARKTHFRKNTLRGGEGETAFYDLTGLPDKSGQSYKLKDMRPALSNVDENSIAALPYSFADYKDVIRWCGLLMKESPVAGGLWTLAEQHGWAVGLTDLHNGGFYLDIPGRILYLDHFSMTPSALGRSVYFRNAVISTFIRALRDIWHEYYCGPVEEIYAPEDVLMIERVRAADSDTVTLLAGWELRGAGHAEIWRHLIGSSEGDMALIFTRFLERDPKALFDGAALAYAFRQWYADDMRVDGCDHETLEALDNLFLDREESRRYFGRQELEAEIIEQMSRLPDGTLYLDGYGETIKTDPFFAGLNDPINQTHLFHLMYDMEVVMVNNVPFRNRKLARKIFPD